MKIKCLVLLVLFGMLLAGAQGVSAVTYVTDRYTYPPNADTCDEFNNQYDWIQDTPLLTAGTLKHVNVKSYATGATWKRAGTIRYEVPTGIFTTTDSFQWVNAFGNCSKPTVRIIISTDPPYNASGTACVNGRFDAWVNGRVDTEIPFYTSENNYSFLIYNGMLYNIYFSGTGEWHNFTAGASDEVWNPPCPTEYSVSGRVIGPDGEGTNGLLIQFRATPILQNPIPETFTDIDGNYSFAYATPGIYIIHGIGGCDKWGECAKYLISDNGVYSVQKFEGIPAVVPTFTYPIKQQIRIKVQYQNGTAIDGGLMNKKDLPTSSGTWKTTASDGYTTYTGLYPSRFYVNYHGTESKSASALYSAIGKGYAYYEFAQTVFTIPDDLSNNTTIPPIPEPVDETNKTDITKMIQDDTFLVSVYDMDSNPLTDVTVTVTAENKNYTGQFRGYTNASGQYSFPKNHTVGQYVVSVALTCYLPETLTRYSSATFNLEYSCGAPPGTDENGTGGWGANNSNWTYNGTLESENDMKTKVSSFMYIVLMGLLIIALITYFVKK